MLNAASENLSKALRCELSEIVQSFGRRFSEEDTAMKKSDEIEKDNVAFSSPLSIISLTKQAISDIGDSSTTSPMVQSMCRKSERLISLLNTLLSWGN